MDLELMWCRRNKQDLMTQLNELKTELASLRVQKIAGGSASKLTKMCVVVESRFSFKGNGSWARV